MELVRDTACKICNVLDDSHYKNSIIFETKFFRVSLAPDQFYLGRVYLTALDHIPEFEELLPEELMSWFSAYKMYSKIVKLTFGATMLTHDTLMNNAYGEAELDSAGVAHPHVHTHIRPRYREPVILEGTEFKDEAFGSHHLRGGENVFFPDTELFELIASMLKETASAV